MASQNLWISTDRWAYASSMFLSVTLRISLVQRTYPKSRQLCSHIKSNMEMLYWSSTQSLRNLQSTRSIIASPNLYLGNQLATKRSGCPWDVECRDSPSIPNQRTMCAGEPIYWCELHCTPAVVPWNRGSFQMVCNDNKSESFSFLLRKCLNRHGMVDRV
jgi:hypothetical protein